MKVIIDADLFEDTPVNHLDLLALFRLGFTGRHLLQIAPISDLRVETWLSKQAEGVTLECRLALEIGIRHDAHLPAANVLRVSAGSAATREGCGTVLCLKDAVELLQRPFRILVEDNVADRNFLLAVAMSESRKVLSEGETKNWITFEHGGRSGLVKRPEQYGAKQLEPLQTWVLADSDALAPGLRSTQAKSVAEACGRNISFHLLMRRAVENYLPVVALEHWAEHTPMLASQRVGRKQRVRALKALKPEQRHHYNMKDGFKGDANRSDKDDANALYEDVPLQSRRILADGFGMDIALLFDGEKHPLPDFWLVADGSPSETSPMITRLLSLL
jgi:hypothetical protein